MIVQNVTTADRVPLLYNLCGCELLSLDASTRVNVTPQSVSRFIIPGEGAQRSQLIGGHSVQ